MYVDSPVIISASRSTDIPAFYSKWFAERLKEGYVMNKNAYKGYITKVNLDKARVYVFWTKNPEPLIPYLHHTYTYSMKRISGIISNIQ